MPTYVLWRQNPTIGTAQDVSVTTWRQDLKKALAAESPRGEFRWSRAQACRGEARFGKICNRPRDELRLAAVAVWGDHVEASDMGSGFGAVVAAYDVQAQVQAGGEPGRSENVTIVDIEDIGHYLDTREGFGEEAGRHPVRGRAGARRAGRRERARTPPCRSTSRGRTWQPRR